MTANRTSSAGLPALVVAPDTAPSRDPSLRLSTASAVSHMPATDTPDASPSSSSLSIHGLAGLASRESLGGGGGNTDTASPSPPVSRQSSGSYYSAVSSLSTSSSAGSRLSMVSAVTSTTNAGTGGDQRVAAKRRGYMRPQGTDFAASARSRESVLSLGSIAHLQHYFARTGLLDLKGQLERRRRGGKARTLDLSQLEATPSSPFPVTDADSSYASMGSSPDLSAAGRALPTEDSPAAGDEDNDNDWYADDDDDNDLDDADMLPPTVSTYQYREKPLPKPPSLVELRADLKTSLDSAAKALAEVREAQAARLSGGPATPGSSAPSSPVRQQQPGTDDAAAGRTRSKSRSNSKAATAATSWHEIQGMHILDVITLAIRAAKVYYTSHEHPDRLDALKPEREVRSELLGVLEVLKRMATRSFAGGVRGDELRAMDAWIASLYAMLAGEDAIVAAERAEQAGWAWLHDADWPADVVDPAAAANAPADRARAYAREHAFLQAMLRSGAASDSVHSDVLPPWTPMDRAAVAEEATEATKAAEAAPAPTPFLQHMRNGVALVQVHNGAVRMSRRRFGAIPSFHADTRKPYRAADNLRYWVKAAELRWEVLLKIDALGVACNSRAAVWPAFEDAVYQWSRSVRREITAELAAGD